MKRMNRETLVEAIEKFIDENSLSVLVAMNQHPGGYGFINLGVIVHGQFALDVAESKLTLNESSNLLAYDVKEYSPFIVNLEEDRQLLQEADKELIRKEVEQINEYLKTLLG
jgi:hypothetical protein